MFHPTHRRQFFRDATLIAAGAAGGLAGGLVPIHAPAIEPIQRSARPRFKFSLAAYSYRDLIGGKSPTLKLEDFIDDCARMELEGTELTSYYFPKDATPEYLRKIKSQCFRLGLDISGTAVGNNFCLPPGEKRDEQLAMVRQWIVNAEILGAPVIRIFAGTVAKGQDPGEAHKLIVEGIEQCCELAGAHGVFLALENHGGPTSTADGLLALVRDVQSPWFGVNVDTGNFHSPTCYEELERIAPYALNVQVKVVMSPSGGAKEPADFKRLARIMTGAGYRGYIVLEYEEKENPREVCPRYIQELRAAFA